MSDTIKIPRPDFSRFLAQPASSDTGKYLPAAESDAQDAAAGDAAAGKNTPPYGGGYDPYGAAPREQRLGRGPRDLRALSKTIEARRLAEMTARHAMAHLNQQVAAARAGSTGEYPILQAQG